MVTCQLLTGYLLSSVRNAPLPCSTVWPVVWETDTACVKGHQSSACALCFSCSSTRVGVASGTIGGSAHRRTFWTFKKVILNLEKGHLDRKVNLCCRIIDNREKAYILCLIYLFIYTGEKAFTNVEKIKMV